MTLPCFGRLVWCFGRLARCATLVACIAATPSVTPAMEPQPPADAGDRIRQAAQNRRPFPGRDGRGDAGPVAGMQEMLRRTPLMRALDTDGDGVLSREEIANAPAALKALDRNGDGQIDRQELTPNLRAMRFLDTLRERGGMRRGPGEDGPDTGRGRGVWPRRPDGP